jgi:outer membrane protein assembly factor BamB
MPSEEIPRMHVDNAFHAAMAEGNVVFGSSVNNEVYCVAAATGAVRWTYSAQGPVRFAPTSHEGRIYFGADDGYAYCLSAQNGSLVWKYRAGPSDEKVIGNGRMISLWPVRTSVLVERDVAYFAAGVFPYEGLFVCAVSAQDGSVVWKNDTLGDHAHELEYGGISPHGYLLASDDLLFVPSGRAMPAAFDRRDGSFRFYASPGGKRGGVWALLEGGRLIAGTDNSGKPVKVAYDARTGKRQGDAFAWFPGIDLVVTAETAYALTQDGILAINRETYRATEEDAAQLSAAHQKLASKLASLRQQSLSATESARKTLAESIENTRQALEAVAADLQALKNSGTRWSYARKGLASLILADNVIFAGGDNGLFAIDAVTGQEAWAKTVQGTAVGLAFAESRLVVSTASGHVYCYGENKTDVARRVDLGSSGIAYPKDDLSDTYETAAETILANTGARKGYCLVLNSEEGRLAYELARRTELHVIGLEMDPRKRAVARLNLEAAGLLGTRVIIEPWDIKDLPDCFANLIVADGQQAVGRTSVPETERRRVLRPWGGAECLSVLREGKLSWITWRRGALEGSGSWTQQYANPQNTACSEDQLVNGPLGILWFGEPGPQGMVERHGRAQSPVAMQGRMFMQGAERLMAVDAFNGTLLWQRDLPGSVRVKIKADAGNLALNENGLYVAAGDKCYRLDPATGQTTRVFPLPTSSASHPRRWGYLSVVGTTLYGSTAAPMEQEYAALAKAFLANGTWRAPEDVPGELREAYHYCRSQFPEPVDFQRAGERSGLFYRTMTGFARGGEFTQRNSVTENLMSADSVFAMNTETGELLWQYQGKRIANITIALGDGSVFFAQSGIEAHARDLAHQKRRELIRAGVFHEREGILDELEEKRSELAALKRGDGAPGERGVRYLISSLEAELFKEESDQGSLTYDDADVRMVTALDGTSGQILWEIPLDLTGCGGDKMGAAYSDGLVLFYGNHGNHDAWRFRAGGMKWRRITALSARNGEVRWSRPLNYRTRPVIVGDRIILEPRACELQTGKTIMRTHPVTDRQVPWEFLRPGHTCGLTAASAQGLFYRSACTAFYDLAEDRGVTVFGAYRPGCAISTIPASGVLLSQEAAAGCTCSYPIRCSLAMIRKPGRPQPWTVYVTPGAMTPVSHLAINLGAAGDMKDREGTVWFGYPHPNTTRYTHFPGYGVKFGLSEEILPGMGYFNRDFKGVLVEDTDKPWLFTSGCLGLSRVEVPLINPEAGDNAAVYTVRLGFMAGADDRPGRRVFDLKLQAETVLSNFDTLQKAGTPERAVVMEFRDILVEEDLVLELIPKTARPTADEAPTLNFIELVHQETVGP